MLLYIFLSCQNDHLDNNKKKSSTPYICESEEKSASLDSNLEPQTSNWSGRWSHFLLPKETEIIYTYPHKDGILLTIHTGYDFLERNKNHSHLYWWGQDCFGEFAFGDIQNCSSNSFEQTCIIDEQENFFGHIMFLENSSESIENVVFSNTSYQIPDSSIPISRVLEKDQNIYYQNRQNIYNSNYEPILSQDVNRYILDSLITDEGIVISQLQPELKILHIQLHNDSFDEGEYLSITKPIQNQEWTIWSDYLLFLQKANTLHVSSVQSLQEAVEIPLSSNYVQICSNQNIWALSEDKKLIAFTIDSTSNTVVEEDIYSLQLDAASYQLHCSTNALYLYDTVHRILHRLHME